MTVNEADTIRPSHQAGSLPADPILPRGKKKPCYTRSTSKVGQSWKSVIGDSGRPEPVTCPRCGAMIVYDQRGVASCGNCVHLLTRQEREELDALDPEMIPARSYMERFDASVRLYKKTSEMSGKERREKRFLSKCAGGC